MSKGPTSLRCAWFLKRLELRGITNLDSPRIIHVAGHFNTDLFIRLPHQQRYAWLSHERRTLWITVFDPSELDPRRMTRTTVTGSTFMISSHFGDPNYSEIGPHQLAAGPLMWRSLNFHPPPCRRLSSLLSSSDKGLLEPPRWWRWVEVGTLLHLNLALKSLQENRYFQLWNNHQFQVVTGFLSWVKAIKCDPIRPPEGHFFDFWVIPGIRKPFFCNSQRAACPSPCITCP